MQKFVNFLKKNLGCVNIIVKGLIGLTYIMQKVDIIEINEDHAHSSKLLASALSDPQTRKRGMIDMLGISCSMSYLHAKKIRVDSKRSVHKIPLLFEEFKITDIYHNSYRIDVITLFKEKTIKIPKIQADMDIMPHFYFVVQIGSKIKEAKMIGFIDSKSVLRCSHDSKFYYPTLDLIFDIDEFLTRTRQFAPQKPLLGKHVDCMGLFLKFIDNNLSSVYKKQMIQHLMSCDSCRARFIDAMEFERLANNISYYPDLAKKCENVTQVSAVPPEASNSSKFSDLEKEGEEFEKKTKTKEIKTPPQAPPKVISKPEEAKLLIPKVQKMITKAAKNKAHKNKKVIDSIFNEIPKIEIPAIKTIAKSKHKKAVIGFALILLVIGLFSLISIKGAIAYKENKDLANYEQYDIPGNYEEEFDLDGQTISSSSGKSIDDFIIQQPISTKPTYSPGVADVAWEVPESLTKKEDYTKFLQLTGKNVRLNLQNDLLLVSDVPINKTVKADIKIASNGDVDSIKIVNSSGSSPIDSAVKKVIGETLTFMKPPSHGISIKPVVITLTVALN